ncbi:MAG: DEAD/DEAH box helicase [Candidatus Competibacteraceae bacterium]
MSESKIYSARTVFEGLKKTFHQYLEAQYHIWDEDLIAERRRLLDLPGVTFQEPQVEATPSYTIGKAYRQLNIPGPAQDILTLAATRSNVGVYPEPYVHQAAALEAFLGRHEEIIVATGTGSGKTECFLMPILGSLALESAQRPASWKVPGCRALLLYPMNALVNDQLARLRRLLGDPEIAQGLKGNRNRRATFGMYTSRTPYPGRASPENDQRWIGALLEKQYQGLSAEARARLEKEGKWPAKNIERFIQSSFNTGPEDSELFSRQEMQKVCPDLLITNYSMLEYMLLRPIERTIFEQTAQWLACNPENRFIIVLDETHMYRGSGGAEVAYLLRRLHSRLGVNRTRVRYILTSASLGSSDEAHRKIKRFAADLTGLDHSSHRFRLITGEIDKKPGECAATPAEAHALAEYDFTTLHRIYESTTPAEETTRQLLTELHKPLPAGPLDEATFRYLIYDFLQSFGPAALAVNRITARPRALNDIAGMIFPNVRLKSNKFIIKPF